jgi:two-component system response regulator MprA
VLVVEDEEMIRDSVIEFLDDQGFEAFGASDGREALDKLTNGQPLPCLILLDLMMPVMDGRAFRERQLQDPELAEIPVLVFSAYQDVAVTANELGVAGYLAKPVDLSRLLRLIQQSCSRS